MVNPKQLDDDRRVASRGRVEAITARSSVVSLEDGDAEVLEARTADHVQVVPGSGATVTVSKVDSQDASSHDSDSSEDLTSETTRDAVWPFYRVSTAGGSARVAVT